MKLWATERFNLIDSYLNELVRKNAPTGMNEAIFLIDVLLPVIRKSGFSVQINSTIRILDVFPDESVSLIDQGDAAIIKEKLENTIALPCAPFEHNNIHE